MEIRYYVRLFCVFVCLYLADKILIYRQAKEIKIKIKKSKTQMKKLNNEEVNKWMNE